MARSKERKKKVYIVLNGTCITMELKHVYLVIACTWTSYRPASALANQQGYYSMFCAVSH